VEVERVIGIGGIVRVAAQGLLPADDLADVFDDTFTGGDGLEREHALAMHTAFSNLDPAAVGTGRLRCLAHSVH
jgi:hypothetical protein